jgi:DNA-binding ferritin-like protein
MSQNTTDKQAYLNATPMQREVVRRLLCDVLGCLRAQYLSYQTSHWMVKGGSFYGNHLLFQRLYKSVEGQVDSLAEKIVGYLGSEAVALNHQAQHIAEYCRRWSGIDCNHKRGLQSEADLQQALRRAYDGIKQVQAMSLGLDDWIMATANAHEENEYLLQQALAPIPGEGKQAATDEGYFYKAPNQRAVLEFANSNALSNDVAVVEKASQKDHLDIPEREAVAEAEEAPPLPTEIAKEPGAAAVSTLNQYVIKSEDPVAEQAVPMNEARMASWLKELE